MTAPFVGQGFYDLVVDPANSTRLVACTTGGLYVSTDGGATWTQRRSADDAGRCRSRRSGAKATPRSWPAARDGVQRSTNGGTTWANVALPGAPGSFDRLAVAIAPTNPAVAYAWGGRTAARPPICGAAPAARGPRRPRRPA